MLFDPTSTEFDIKTKVLEKLSDVDVPQSIRNDCLYILSEEGRLTMKASNKSEDTPGKKELLFRRRNYHKKSFAQKALSLVWPTEKGDKWYFFIIFLLFAIMLVINHSEPYLIHIPILCLLSLAIMLLLRFMIDLVFLWSPQPQMYDPLYSALVTPVLRVFWIAIWIILINQSSYEWCKIDTISSEPVPVNDMQQILTGEVKSTDTNSGSPITPNSFVLKYIPVYYKCWLKQPNIYNTDFDDTLWDRLPDSGQNPAEWTTIVDVYDVFNVINDDPITQDGVDNNLNEENVGEKEREGHQYQMPNGYVNGPVLATNFLLKYYESALMVTYEPTHTVYMYPNDSMEPIIVSYRQTAIFMIVVYAVLLIYIKNVVSACFSLAFRIRLATTSKNDLIRYVRVIELIRDWNELLNEDIYAMGRKVSAEHSSDYSSLDSLQRDFMRKAGNHRHFMLLLKDFPDLSNLIKKIKDVENNKNTHLSCFMVLEYIRAFPMLIKTVPYDCFENKFLNNSEAAFYLDLREASESVIAATLIFRTFAYLNKNSAHEPFDQYGSINVLRSVDYLNKTLSSDGGTVTNTESMDDTATFIEDHEADLFEKLNEVLEEQEENINNEASVGEFLDHEKLLSNNGLHTGGTTVVEPPLEGLTSTHTQDFFIVSEIKLPEEQHDTSRTKNLSSYRRMFSNTVFLTNSENAQDEQQPKSGLMDDARVYVEMLAKLHKLKYAPEHQSQLPRFPLHLFMKNISQQQFEYLQYHFAKMPGRHIRKLISGAFFISIMSELNETRSNALSKGITQILDVFNKIVNVTFWVIAFLVALAIYGVPFSTILISGVAGLATVAGFLSYLYKDFSESVLLTCIINPYNIGDR